MKEPLSRFILTGLLFAMLWSSASVAGKFGLTAAEPLLFFTIRFLAAGTILLGYSSIIRKERLPRGNEWKHLLIFGAFNTTLYLGIFIIALQYITAGITALAIALNPLLISLMSSAFYGRKVLLVEWLSIGLGMIGVFIASYPLLGSQYVSWQGLLLLGLSMIAYSFGSVYYATVKWQLNRVAINGWQVLIGGILLIPFTIAFYRGGNNFNSTFYLSLFWLIVPVSIGAVQLWLILLKADAVRASLWLYLCPIFGLLFSVILLNEPLTTFTLIGTLLVLSAVFIGQRRIAPPRTES